MADTIAITAGSGTTVGTDEVTIGGTLQHVQRIKLVDGADGGTALIGGDATNGLDVDVTRIIPGTGATALGKAEDAAHTTGDTGVFILGVRRDTAAASSGTDGDYEPLSTDSTGRLRVSTAPANSGVDIGDVDILSVIPGSGATNLGKAEDAVHTTGDIGVLTLGVRRDTAAASSGTDGDYEPLSTDSTGRLRIAALPANSGVDIGDVDVLSMPTTTVTGTVAHDGVDSGNPQKVGGQARTTNPTAVADADRSNFITDKLGKQVVVNSIRDLKGVQQTAITSSTAETTIVTAVASTFLDLYGLIISNTSATIADVTIKDSTAGTTRAIITVPADDVRGFMLTESAAIPQATVNTSWTATSSASVASLQITALFVKNT